MASDATQQTCILFCTPEALAMLKRKDACSPACTKMSYGKAVHPTLLSSYSGTIPKAIKFTKNFLMKRVHLRHRYRRPLQPDVRHPQQNDPRQQHRQEVAISLSILWLSELHTKSREKIRKYILFYD